MKDQERLENHAYELYRVDWMKSHNHTLADFATSVLSHASQLDSDFEPEEILEDWELNYGFGGEIWACKDEFLQSEYLDRTYMKYLLSKTDFELWKKFTKEP